MERVAICGANAINAITDIIHDYYCGARDRQKLQVRLQDAFDQLNGVKEELIRVDGELYKPQKK